MMFDKYVGSVTVTKNIPSSARDREKWWGGEGRGGGMITRLPCYSSIIS